MMTVFERRAIAMLAPWADIAAPILECLSRPAFPRIFDEGALCNQAGLPPTQSVAVLELLRTMKELALVGERPGMLWESTARPESFSVLAPLLEVIGFYRAHVHQDRTTAEVVLTRPGQPSKLEEALRDYGFPTGHMEITSEAFRDLAVSARKSLVVMTPFLDVHGGEWLGKLLREARPEVKKTLILRYLRDTTSDRYPEGIAALRSTIAELRVEVFDYALSRTSGGFETFHAKVIVADGSYAYVGSANMNRASLEYSMELGVLLRGEAARRIAGILEAIKKASRLD